MSGQRQESRRVERRSHASDRLAAREREQLIEPTDDDIRVLEPDDPDITDGGTPETALEALAAEKKAADERAAAAEKRARDAETEAARARAAGAQNADAAIQRQEDAINNALAAAKGEHDAAKAEWRRAKDEGDADKEMDAVEKMTRAAARVQRAEDNVAGFKNWKAQQADRARQQQVRQPQQEEGPSPEALRWIGTHPAYNYDPKYRADAMSAHDLWRADHGEADVGSQAYVDFIDQHMEKLYGKNHGQIDRGGRKGQDDMDNQNRRSSTAAPRGESRSSGGRSGSRDGGGNIVYRHSDGSELRLVQGIDANGKPYRTVEGRIPAEWVEAAKITNMPLMRYASEQILIQDSMANGGPETGLLHERSGVYK